MKKRPPTVPTILLLAGVLGACKPGSPAAPSADPQPHTATPFAARTEPAGNPTPDPTVTSGRDVFPPCNAAELIADVSIPEGWQVGPSEHFTKTWRLQNTGGCAWNAGYFIVHDGGERMGAPNGRQISVSVVQPGETVDVSLDLIAPGAAGSYLGTFRLRADDGTIFGVGKDGGDPLRVDIRVVLGEPRLTTFQVGRGVVVAPGASGEVTAECPAGTTATGGGFDGDGSMTAHFQGLEGNGWHTAATNNGETDKTLSSYAICLADDTRMLVTQATDDKIIYPGTLGQSNVGCPGGSVVSGIGYAFDPATMAIAGGDRMGIVARIFAFNISTSNQTLHGKAVCLTPFTRVSYLPIRNEQQIPGHAVTTLEAVCPPSTFLTGGGFRIFSEDMTVVGLSKKPEADAWLVTAENHTGSPQVLMSLALCVNLAMM